MSNPYFEQLPMMGNFMSSIMAFNKITAELIGEIAKEQMKAQQALMKKQSEHLHNLSQAKAMEEVMSLQADYLQKISPELLSHGQNIIDSMLLSMGEYAKLMEIGLDQINKDHPIGKSKAQKH